MPDFFRTPDSIAGNDSAQADTTAGPSTTTVVVQSSGGQRQSNAQVRRSVRAALSGAGQFFPFPVNDLITRAVQNSHGDSALAMNLFQTYLYNSARFRNYYPGIFRPNGTLRMNPAEYDQYVHQAKAAAASAGFTVSRAQLGTLIARDVSPEEFGFRVTAARTIAANRGSINQFNAILKARGEEPLRTGEQVFDFLAGKANAKVYNIYEQYSVAEAGRQVGLDVSARQANRIANATGEVDSVESVLDALGRLASKAGFEDVGDFLDSAGADLRSFGISDREVLRGALGTGKKARRLGEAAAQAGRQARARATIKPIGQQVSLNDQGNPVVGPQVFEDSL